MDRHHEPDRTNAGSDLAAVRKAEPQGRRTYRIFGQKIFITYGDHDMADNIVHPVLARTPTAPGVKGISLFWCRSSWSMPTVRSARANDAWCVSIEHKLGIPRQPDGGDGLRRPRRRGRLSGRRGENRGPQYMFIMMNAARFGVGLEGVADGERAYQRAVTYARDRIRGTDIGVRGGGRWRSSTTRMCVACS